MLTESGVFLPARSMAHPAERVALLPTEGESFTKPSTTTGAAEVVNAMEDIGELRAVRRDARAKKRYV